MRPSCAGHAGWSCLTDKILKAWRANKWHDFVFCKKKTKQKPLKTNKQKNLKKKPQTPHNSFCFAVQNEITHLSLVFMHYEELGNWQISDLRVY